VLVLGVSDTDVHCYKLIALHLKRGEELSDIAPFWAAHVEEGLMQVGLHIYALCSVEGIDGTPLCLCCCKCIYVYSHLNGEMLAKEALGDDILAIPSFAI
jgi:hypothetical protein